jgi:cytochrome bd-type quinol oxidase subunit 2
MLTVLLFALSFFPRSVSAVATCTNGTLMNGVCVPSGSSTGLPETDIAQVLTNVMNWLLSLVGLLAIFMFVVAGVQYLTAAGDEKQTETAKSTMKNAAVGVAVSLLGFVVVNTVYSLVTGYGIGQGSYWY